MSEVNFTKIDDPNYLAQAILKVKNEAHITSNHVTASFADFCSFFFYY